MIADPKLIDDVRKQLPAFPLAVEVAEPEASRLLDDLARHHVADTGLTWWWTGLKHERARIPYGEKDGFEAIGKLVPLETVVLMVITDDEPRPWSMFRGSIADLLAILREVRFCEYFISDPAYQWVIFDTHENDLVVAGTLPESARRIQG